MKHLNVGIAGNANGLFLKQALGRLMKERPEIVVIHDESMHLEQSIVDAMKRKLDAVIVLTNTNDDVHIGKNLHLELIKRPVKIPPFQRHKGYRRGT